MTRVLALLFGLIWLVVLGLAGPLAAQETPFDPGAAQSGPQVEEQVADEIRDAAASDEDTNTQLIESLQALVGESIDLEQWQSLHDRAETVIDRNQASGAAIEELRTELVAYRNQFTAIRNENRTRIRTLRAQIEKLGAIPETGQEPESVALTRQSLNLRLDHLLAPSIAAEAAFGLTDGLIAEIDALQRARQAEAFATQGPSPLNPTLWPKSVIVLSKFGDALWSELKNSLSNEVTRQAARQRAPRILVMLALGFFLLLRGRSLSRRFGDFMRRWGGHGSGVWDFLISLGTIFIPYAGVVLIVNALSLSGIPGFRGAALLSDVPNWAGTLLVVAWLRDRLFSQQAAEEGSILAAPRRLPEITFMITLLGIFLVVSQAVLKIIQMERAEETVAAVLMFPLFVLTSMVLFRLAVILRPDPPEPSEDGAEETSRPSVGYGPILPALTWVSRAVAIAVPLAAAAGYYEAAVRTLFPMIWTLALFGAVVALHSFVAKFYAWASGAGTAAKESLFPALAGVVMVLVAVPLAAVIWGVRVSDLNEIWSRFLEGVEIGETRVSPVDFLMFVIVFGLGYAATRLLQGALRSNILPKTSIDHGGQTAIVSGMGYVGIFLAALIAISSTGLDLSSLAIVAGALSVGIGFGLQTIVSNFVSGIILLIERPVSEGDWIEVGAHSGIVKAISVRATRIETFDRMDVIVPNSDLISGSVTNYTRSPVGRVILSVGVAYGTDTRKVSAILQEIAEDHPMALARPAPFILFRGFGADSLDFEVRVVIRDVNFGLTVRNDLNHAIAERFVAEGIEIPFAQRDVWLRNPEALAGTDERTAAEITGAAAT